MDGFSIAYISAAAVVLLLQLATMGMSLSGMIKNRLSLWSPHPELFFYVLGNMFTTLSFLLRWFGDLEHEEAPFFFAGQMCTISALLILNNRMQFILDSEERQLLPFWVCTFDTHRNGSFLLQFAISLIPYLAFNVVDIVIMLTRAEEPVLQFVNDTLFTVLIYYHSVLLILSANKYAKMNSGMTRYSRLQYSISILTFADSLIGQGFYWGLTLFYMFALPFDADLVEDCVYVKDWMSLIIYFIVNILVFMSLKDIFVIKKRMKMDVELECLAD